MRYNLCALCARSEHRRPQRVEGAAHRETGGEEEPEDEDPRSRPLRAELGREGETGVVQAGLDRAGRHGENLGDLGDGLVEEVVQDDRLALVRRKRFDGLAQEPGVDGSEDPGRGVRVAGVLDRVAGGELVAVRRAAHVLGVEVHENLRHPAEERGLLQVVVDPLDDR